MDRWRLAEWLTGYLRAHDLSTGLIDLRGGPNATTVQRIANGTTKDPGIYTLKAIAQGLKIPLETMLEGAGIIPVRDDPNMPAVVRQFMQALRELPPEELELATPPLQAMLDSVIAAVQQVRARQGAPGNSVVGPEGPE
jgi:transcriptional regulator with XRE-family HTH domain